jgi:hypothetical protein
VRRRASEQGGAILIAMIMLSSLAVLASLTVVSVQGGIATSKTHRFHAIAQYAAESGAAAAMTHLRNNLDPALGWKAFITPNNATPISPPGIPGNNIPAGAPGNLFSADMRASFSVVILNNKNDTGFAAGNDDDTIVRIFVTGYGPDGSVATLEWEIQGDRAAAPVPKPFVLIGWRQIL